MRIAAQRQLAILLPALLAATLALACSSADEPARTPGFYAEVAVEVEPQPDDPLARFGVAEGRSVIRWWYAPDPFRWRWELETVGSIIDDGVVLTVVDGDDFWEYDDRSNTYRRGALVVVPAGVMLLPTYNALVGPANAETIDALIEQWRERGDHPEVGLAGEATLLGRRTQIVEIRSPGGGVVRAFVDPERMFIMRWAAAGEGGGQSYSSEVTALDYDTEIDASRFTFDPPPGAREVEAPYVQSCSSSSGPVGGASFPAKPGFLRPAYAPAGYHSTAAGSEGSANGGCGPVAVWPCSKPPMAATSFSASASVPAVSPAWRAPGNPSTPASRTPTATPKAASSASSGATGMSSPSSRAPPCPSKSCCASPSPRALSRLRLDARTRPSASFG